MDSNEKKTVIEQKLKEAGLAYPQIQYDCNYYMGNH